MLVRGKNDFAEEYKNFAKYRENNFGLSK